MPDNIDEVQYRDTSFIRKRPPPYDPLVIGLR